MSVADTMFPDRFSKLDLHGYDRETARVAINDFIKDAKKMKLETVVIIHGTGEGIIRKVTHDTLRVNKDVLEFAIGYFNQGSTIVKIKL